MNHETKIKELQDAIISAQLEYLTEIGETDLELSVNQVSRINDDYDFIQVAYFGLNPDGERQEQYANQIKAGSTLEIDFIEATHILAARIENSL